MTSPVKVTRQEWRWAVAWSLVVIGLSGLPYLLAAFTAPPGWQFAGFLANPLDGHSYLAKIRQGLEGNWLFHLTFTPEAHPGAFIYTFYPFLGHIAAWLGLSPLAIFHLARLVSGFILLLVAYRFIAWVTPYLPERRLAFILLLTASGLGWLGVLAGAFPIDLWVPEAFVPYSLYTNPHFPLTMALMLLIFLTLASPARWWPILWAGLTALVLAIISPFAVLIVGAVLAVHLVWLWWQQRRFPWQPFGVMIGVGVGAAPIILYQYRVMTTDPVLAGWLQQNVTPSPNLLDLLLGYGLVGLLAIPGSWLIIRPGPNRPQSPPESGEWLVLWWALVTLILLYLPVDLQRRLITGLHAPLCILAAIGLRRWLEQRRVRPQRMRQLTLAVVLVGALGTLFVWLIPLLAARQAPEQAETSALLFIRDEESAAFAWLRQNTTMEQVVLASPRVGMFVPGQTGARVYYGHPFETIAAEQKKAAVEAFYRGELDRLTPPVDFVIYGPSERVLGQPNLPADWPVVFSTENLLIFKVPKS